MIGINDQNIRTFNKKQLQEFQEDKPSNSSDKEKRIKDILVEDEYLTMEQLALINTKEGIFVNYTIEQKIGTGRFGVIYKAKQNNMGKRPVVIKFLRPFSLKSVERFRRQVEALGKLQHPHIITAIESGKIVDIDYMVMEYFHGTQLDQYIKGSGNLTEESTLKIAKDLASALQHIWSNNLVHRDIAPQNIMIGKQEVKLCDFNLIRAIEENKEHTHGIPIRAYDYTAPEIIQKGKLSFLNDCFSLGGILYFCLTGFSPFEKANEKEGSSERKPYPIRKLVPHISKSLEKFIQQLLQNTPELRCKNPQSLANDIENLIKINKRNAKQKLIVPILIGALLLSYITIPSFRFFVKKEITSFFKSDSLGEEIYEKRVHSVAIIKTESLLGSGVIIHYNGKNFIVTNAHVVMHQAKVGVLLKNNTSYELKVLDVYEDQNVDIAFLEFPYNVHPDFIMPLAKTIHIGQSVFAIGHPKGYEWSITSGTVSAIRGDTIQTDTPINLGNSGGPLLNKHGEMIGINTFIIKQANSVSFAISTQKIIECLQLSEKKGKL